MQVMVPVFILTRDVWQNERWEWVEQDDVKQFLTPTHTGFLSHLKAFTITWVNYSNLPEEVKDSVEFREGSRLFKFSDDDEFLLIKKLEKDGSVTIIVIPKRFL